MLKQVLASYFLKMARTVRKTDPVKKAGRKDGFNRSGHRFLSLTQFISEMFADSLFCAV